MNKTLTTRKTSRRTETRAVRRGQLIDATITSIARHGIGGTTMATVTEAAGLSQGIVNFHFESKQKLFEETLIHLAREHHAEWVTAYRDAGLGARDKLAAIVDAHFTPRICSRKKLAVWFAFYGESGRRAVYRDLINHIDDERFDVSVGLCEDLTEPDGLVAKRVAETLESLYDGLWLTMLLYPNFMSRLDARAQIYTYLSGVFPSHFAPEGPTPALQEGP